MRAGSIEVRGDIFAAARWDAILALHCVQMLRFCSEAGTKNRAMRR
jgi:hypothetical protein